MLILNYVKARRLQLHLTQYEVAKAVNLTVPGYGNIERGQSYPRPATRRALAECLNCTIEELWPQAGLKVAAAS